jgi:phenylacetate-CoA ligase
MNWKKHAYLSYAALRGYRFPALLYHCVREYEGGLSGKTTTLALSRLLRHCCEMVPYYADLLAAVSCDEIDREPHGCLQKLPLLNKQLIRANFERLQSRDNDRRNCAENTSGGSTGEPVRLIQDDEYRDASAAIQWLSHHQLGCPLGGPHVRLWGSERDLESGTKSRKARFFNWLTNTTWMNAFAMSPERMRGFINALNRMRPRLIVAYAQAIYELAQFAEREQIPVVPQRAVLTSAGTLYPFMRQKISRVFSCEVYNLYGSREVSDIAWELPGLRGLWAPPWANFIEIVDERGALVPAGTEGNIVITSLTNYAMPLVRYWIGDRGALLPASGGQAGVQMLSHVSGRTVDTFRRSDQTLIDGEYFTHLLYFRPWIWKFQVVQKSFNRILFRLVSTNGKPPKEELDDIAARSRIAMGDNCEVEFEFCDELPPQHSGKFRYTISEVCV